MLLLFDALDQPAPMSIAIEPFTTQHTRRDMLKETRVTTIAFAGLG